MIKLIIKLLHKIINILGNSKNKETPNEIPKVSVKTLKIHVSVDLYNKFNVIEKCIIDGYLIPHIHSPYDASSYVRKWFCARNIGDGYVHAVRAFVEAYIETKTSASMQYRNIEIVVEILEGDQTNTLQD